MFGESRLDRATDRAIAEENEAYLAWAKANPAAFRADLDALAVRTWRALGWCERCGSPDHKRYPCTEAA